jgi:hypothetical protein
VLKRAGLLPLAACSLVEIFRKSTSNQSFRAEPEARPVVRHLFSAIVNHPDLASISLSCHVRQYDG